MSTEYTISSSLRDYAKNILRSAVKLTTVNLDEILQIKIHTFINSKKNLSHEFTYLWPRKLL